MFKVLLVIFLNSIWQW